MVAKHKEERIPAQPARPVAPQREPVPPRVTLFEVRQLIALMNTTDLTEIAIGRPADGIRFVLRRATEAVPLTIAQAVLEAQPVASGLPMLAATPASVADGREYVTASLVGIFHNALKAGQKPLVAVGDVIREGQAIGGIETLRVMNEVEAQVSGKVVEILVTPGQPVEFGQRLLAVVPA